MKNFLDKIEDINDEINNLNESIDNLLLSEQASLLKPFAQWMFRSWAKDKIFGDDDSDIDEKKAKEKVDDWLKSDDKDKDIDDAVEKVKKISDETDNKKVEEFREMLIKIADKQKELIKDLLNKKGLEKITLSFNKPIEFKLIRGKGEGRKLKLEKTKTYEVFMVEGKGQNKKIYFNYDIGKENWLRKYSILFVLKVKNPKPGEKYDGVTVSIAYVNDNVIKDKDLKILSEKVLTHKGMVEIQKLK